jgi:predicted negative regulator of RcsB-dependent stress response
MMQQIIIYIVLILALAYVGYRIYSSIKKKQACEKCELMKAVKKNK